MPLSFAAALAGAALFCASAAAQENAAAIEQRIESVFEVVPQNPLSLAVPLSRRALTRRAVETDASGAPAATGTVASPSEEPVGGPPAILTLPAAATVAPGSAEVVEPPAAISEEDADLARLPRPRPSAPQPASPEIVGEPLDLVAGAALPEAARLQSVPQVLLPAAPEPAPPAASPSSAQPAWATATEQPRAKAALVTAAVQPSPLPPARLAESPPAPAAAPAAALPANCLKPGQVADRDDDFSRNKAALSEPGLCITQQKFKERRRPWTIQTVHSTRVGPLWVVMHDDEATAFDNAVQALKTYGGKFMTVDTGGHRNQDGIDPNRNFSADGIGCKKLGNSASPRFSAAFRNAFAPSQPLIVLHNNVGKRIPTGGLGHVAMDTVPKDMRAWKADDPDGPLAGARILVLLAAADAHEPAVETWAEGLSSKGVNVVVEPVSKKSADCSLSNFAVLAGQRNYFNVTVDKDDVDEQRRIVALIMSSFFTVAAAR